MTTTNNPVIGLVKVTRGEAFNSGFSSLFAFKEPLAGIRMSHLEATIVNWTVHPTDEATWMMKRFKDEDFKFRC